MSFLSDYELAKYLMVPERFYSLFNVLVLLLLFVVLLLKGLALWRSARLGQRIWFWIFVFVNTLGILEIVYLIIYKDGFIPAANEAIVRESKKHKKQGKVESKKSGNIDLAEEKNLDMNNWVS